MELCPGQKRKWREIIKIVSKVELWFLYSALSCNVLYHFLSVNKISWVFLEFCTGQEILIKRNNSKSKQGRVMILYVLYHFTKFQQNTLNSLGVMLRKKCDGRTDGRKDGWTDRDHYQIPLRIWRLVCECVCVEGGGGGGGGGKGV